MRPLDTDAAADAVQTEIYRRMGPEGRVRLAGRMSEAARALSLQGIRSRHPEYDDEQARRALFRVLLGDEMVRVIWPGEALVAP